MKRFLAAALLLSLAACGPRSSAPGGAGAPPPPPAAPALVEQDAATQSPAVASAAPDAPAQHAEVKPAPAPAGSPGAPPGGVMLAYAYSYGLEAPPKEVPALMKAHEKSCVDAGAGQCQVLGAATTANGAYDVHARLELRAEPHWLTQFRARLEDDARNAGGRQLSSEVTSEDLTRQIVDTEATLRATKTLRDRLQTLLASRPGKLSELLDVERELARVQGEIDSTESNLAVMRARVSMSLLTIDYASAGAPVTDTTFAPVKDALEGFVRRVAEGFAFMIVLLAVLLPWTLLGAGVGWLALRWRRQRRAERAAREALKSERIPSEGNKGEPTRADTPSP